MQDDPLLRVEYARVGAEITEWSHVLLAQYDTLTAGGMPAPVAAQLVYDTNAHWWESQHQGGAWWDE